MIDMVVAEKIVASSPDGRTWAETRYVHYVCTEDLENQENTLMRIIEEHRRKLLLHQVNSVLRGKFRMQAKIKSIEIYTELVGVDNACGKNSLYKAEIALYADGKNLIRTQARRITLCNSSHEKSKPKSAHQLGEDIKNDMFIVSGPQKALPNALLTMKMGGKEVS
jgi:hypothetical protein